MKRTALLPFLLAPAILAVLPAPATAYYHARLGRFLSRDPIGYAGADANLRRYAGNVPTVANDPSGQWTRWRGRPDTWCADKPTDTLQSLASDEYGSEGSWVCIRPLLATGHGYAHGSVRVGDVYNASNLSTRGHTDVQVNMDYLSRGGNTYQEDRRGASRVATGEAVYELLREASNEGFTPIRYFEIYAHSWNWAGVGSGDQMDMKLHEQGGRSSNFFPGRYSPDEPTPTFARAKQGKFPHRCWFARTATARSFACGGYSFGQAFAGTFLRAGARVYTSPASWRIFNRDPWAGMNDWGFKPPGANVEWYGSMSDFMRAPGWAVVMGQL